MVLLICISSSGSSFILSDLFLPLMFQVKGDLWKLPADIICITTNGNVKKDGKAVMGRGCAQEARDKFAGVEVGLGDLISNYGNKVHFLRTVSPFMLYSFPVKHQWFEDADMELIEQSCQQLVSVVDTWAKVNYKMKMIAIPRPGCGNGKLQWSDVKPICEKYFDDRFFVVTY